jgi:hypothetical protein
MNEPRSIVYKVCFGQTLYLKKFNPHYTGDSEFTAIPAEAKLFTWAQACRIARRLNKGLDDQSRRIYGFMTF